MIERYTPTITRSMPWKIDLAQIKGQTITLSFFSPCVPPILSHDAAQIPSPVPRCCLSRLESRGSAREHFSGQFKNQMLEKMTGQLGKNHSGELKLQTAEAKAERIIAEELKTLGWTQADLQLRLKTDPAKLQIATRLRSETTLTIKAIAERLHLGTAKSANIRLHNIKNTLDSQRRDNVMV